MAVGIVGLVNLLRAVGPARRDAAVGLAVLAAFLLLMSGWSNPTGGASPGPRYVVPALPFLAGGVAWAWQRAPAVGWLAAAVGAVTMGLATYTQPLMPRTETALRAWAALAREGRTAQTWLTEATGSPWGVVAPLVVAAGLGVWLLRHEAAAYEAEKAGASRS